uniref:Uncharacterized protein n=1 Tax=Serratia proteamaculans TaxID=28151 RepID=A0A2R2Q2H6_SERPR|nr:hypothetical protein [Serratia proteamaculans]ULG13375.1 hypothetical protein AGR96Xp_00005 [Serratia proteamaculans]ULG17201.1 hypothetical protein 20093p_00113 [Serratia proteamaculans]ULG18089.1 hypothetical protein LCp1_00113 [Serratia proteamaculans]ULG19574.1 hypothetical protein Sprot5p_00083 [Serratia proteamaculans]
MVAQAVEKIAEANQAFEFNHLGNDLLESPALEYIARSFLRRTTRIVIWEQDSLTIAYMDSDDVLLIQRNEDV